MRIKIGKIKEINNHYYNGCEQMDKIEKAIIEFFMSKDKVDDADIHKLAESLGTDPHEFEVKIYGILSSILSGGRSKGKKFNGKIDPSDFDKAIKVEMEHTSNPDVAKKIVTDHLFEFGMDYYKELDKMEQKLKEQNKGSDMNKVAKLLDGIARTAEEKQAKSLKQRKTDFILNMDTSDMDMKQYKKQKAKVNAMTEEEFNTMFKSIMSRD